MRGIKFRALELDSSSGINWVYGYYVEEKGMDYKNDPCTRYYIIDENGLKYDIAPDTAGQFTGLKDSKGVEVYGGDICEIDGGAEEPAICWIIFKDGCFCIDWNENDGTPELKYYIDMDFCSIHVVGNINETPELIPKPTQG